MPIETKMEFIERHGGQKALVRMPNHEYLLPTGARITEGWNGAQLHEPPISAEERLKAKRRYWATLAERATADFHALKAAVTGDGPTYHWKEDEHGPLPDREPATALRILRELVLKYRAAVADIDKKYEALPAVIQRRKAEAEQAARERELDAAHQRRVEAERAAIAAITLDD